MQPRLELRLSQKLVMTPQLQQAIKLLQLSRLELQEALTQQLEENPMLEEAGPELEDAETDTGPSDDTVGPTKGDEPEPTAGSDTAASERDDSASSWDEYFDDDRKWGDVEAPRVGRDEMPSIDQTMAQGTTLEEHLLWQLALSPLDKTDLEIGRAIIGNIDEDGYLRVSLASLINTNNMTPAHAAQVLKVVQGFDPSGVAARDLKECLAIQIEQLGLSGSLVEAIVVNHLPDLERKRYPAIAKALGASVEAVVHATKIIEGLEPKPGRPFYSSDSSAIIPDVYVVKSDGAWIVMLNDDGIPRFRISFEQRNKTIARVVESIVKFQEPFFEHGVQYLRPMILRDVAEDVSMHESTISRVTSNKYLHCPQGIYELKYFFNASIPRSQEGLVELSSVAVREMIRKMVDQEDPVRPLKDQEIVARLQAQNVVLARRTVAKYRMELNIPSASRRKRSY